MEKNFSFAVRNVPKMDFLPAIGINVYDIIRRDLLILSVDALTALNERFKKMTIVSNERSFEIIRSPLISEKATFVSQYNYYVFKVSNDSNKYEIKQASSKLV